MILQSWTDDSTIKTVAQWRHDSATLARLRPVLDRLRLIQNQPCTYGPNPFDCQTMNWTCVPCAVRDIKEALFGADNDGLGN